MVFKEFGKDIINLSKNYKTLNVVTSEQVNSLGLLTNNLNSLKDIGNLTTDSMNGLYKSVQSFGNDNLTDYFQSVAEGAENARVNIVDAYAAILDGNTHGLKNVQGIMNTFNNAFDGNVEKQKEFAKAVGQSNKTLGVYLNSLGEGATADLKNYGAELVKAKAKTIGLTIKTAALNTLLSVGMSLAITGIVTLISKAISKQEELKEKYEDTIEKSKELSSNLKEENAKLTDIIDKYNELSQKTELTSSEKETLNDFQEQLIDSYGREASGIDLVNGKYEDNLEILKKINAENLKALEINQKRVYSDAKTKYNDFGTEMVQDSVEMDENGNYVGIQRVEFDFDEKTQKLIQQYLSGFDENGNRLKDSEGNLVGGGIYKENIIVDGNEIEIRGLNTQDYIQNYQELLKILDMIQGRSALLGGVDLSTDNGYQTLVSDLETALNLQTELDNSAKDYADTLYESFVRTNGNAPTNESDFKEWAEKLKHNVNPTGDSSLSAAINDIINESSNAFKIDSEGNVALKSLSELISSSKEELSSLKEQVDEFFDSQSTVQSALDELAESGTLSYDTVKKLSDAGFESAISFNTATNSYELNRDKLNELINAQKLAITTDLEQSKSTILLSSKQSEEYEALEEWRKKTGRSVNDVVYQHKLEELGINDLVSSYDLYIDALKGAKTETSDYSQYISDLNTKIKEHKEFIDSFGDNKSIIQKATEEQNTFGRISSDTINSLYEAGLDGAMSFNEMTGETYFLVDAIDELTRVQRENQEAAINRGIIATQNIIANAEADIKKLGVIDSESDAKEANRLYGIIDESKEKLKELNKQKQQTLSFQFSFETDSEDVQQSAEEAVEEYINSIKEAFDKEKSDLDHLLNMDVISQEEYYNRLFDLNEKYFKGKTELLDEYRQYEEEVYKGLKETQIKAIQEQIDALKSVNEEKQEEIDLEKAKQALENAKRNKTISVYDSERGWIRETDRNAIDSAQKEYDDLVLNEKVEVLENLIDAIENGTNTNHNLDESVNAVEQVNSLGQRVISGNVDLAQLFSGAVANRMNEIQNSINSNIPIALANQFDRSISSDSYTTNNNNTITLNGVTVMANNPEEFIAQMEDIANERFKENFPAAMNQFGRDLQRYKMNHSL